MVRGRCAERVEGSSAGVRGAREALGLLVVEVVLGAAATGGVGRDERLRERRKGPRVAGAGEMRDDTGRTAEAWSDAGCHEARDWRCEGSAYRLERARRPWRRWTGAEVVPSRLKWASGVRLGIVVALTHERGLTFS